MKILVEDSTTGYELWQLINKYYLGNKFEVIGCRGNRALLNEITNNKQKYKCTTVLIVDAMIDNHLTLETYENIRNVIKDNTNFILPAYGCLERELMTYRLLPDIVGDTKQVKYQMLVDIISKYSDPCQVIYGLPLDKYRGLGLKYKDKSSEKIYKALYNEYTQNSEACLRNGKIVKCIQSGCCAVSNTLYMNKCQINKQALNQNQSKIQSVVNESELMDIINEIIQLIQLQIRNNYVAQAQDIKYKQAVINKVGVIGCTLIACEICNRTNKWSYRDVHNSIGGTV